MSEFVMPVERTFVCALPTQPMGVGGRLGLSSIWLSEPVRDGRKLRGHKSRSTLASAREPQGFRSFRPVVCARGWHGPSNPKARKMRLPARGVCAWGREGVGVSGGALLHLTVFKINCNGRES